jgi:opacity protein-like surface antigen
MTKRMSIAGLATALAFLVYAGSAMGQLGSLEWQFAGSAGYGLITKLGDLDGTSEVKAKNDVALGLAATVFLDRNWGVRLQWAYIPTSLELEPVPDGVTATDGDEVGGMKAYFLNGALVYRRPLEWAEPYVLAGFGGAAYDPDLDAVASGLLDSGDVHRVFSVVFGAGVVYPVSPQVGLLAEVVDHVTFESIDPDEFVEASFDESTAHHIRLVVGVSVTVGR